MNDSLSYLRERQSWKFDYEFSGESRRFCGSEPENEKRVAELVTPMSQPSLLFERVMDYLHDSPEITDEDWQSFSPTHKASIATTHLDEWNANRLITDEEIEQVREQAIRQARTA